MLDKYNSLQKEEWFNAATHGLGVLFGIFSIPFLVYFALKSRDSILLVGAIVYSLTFLFVYASSTLYHTFNKPNRKAIWRKIDHISIYFMISGTYTPFLLKYMFNPKGLILLTILWTLSLIGIFFKLFYTGKYDNLSTLIYLIMGWSILFVAKPFFNIIPLSILILIAAGGVFYTVGVIFYKWDKLPYNHGIWHLFVLAAGVSHFTGVLLTVV